MSIVYSADLFCDARDKDGRCLQWVHGTTRTHHPPLKRHARLQAQRSTEGTSEEGWTNPHGLDICPMHSAEREDRQ